MLREPTSDDQQAAKRRVLVIADESCLNANLCRLVADHTQGAEAEVLVVAPALNKRLRHYVSDSDAAEQRAGQVLRDCIECMRKHGVAATGVVGDADPLMAIEDWLSDFAADEIVIATHPEDQLNWLERGVVEDARQRFRLPVTHTVVERPLSNTGVFVP